MPVTVGPSDETLPAADLNEGLAAAVRDASGPTLGALSLLFAAFAVHNYFDLPPHAVTPVVAHDLALVAVFAVGWRRFRHGGMPPRWAHPAGAIILALVLSNILLETAIVRDAFDTNYVLIVVVGIGALMLSTRWALGSLVLTICAWSATVWSFAPPAQFVNLAFTVLGAAVLSLALHLTRKRTYRRLLELRHVDGLRKVALERALEETESARADLDRRVDERTRELRLADQVFLSSTSAIVVIDKSERIVRVNPAFVEITGLPPEEVLGAEPRATMVAPDQHSDAVVDTMREAFLASGRWEGEVTFRRRSGETFPAWVSMTTVRDAEGRVSHHVGMFNDITARKAAEARIEFMAHHDALTGLPNRIRLRQRFQEAAARTRAGGGNIAMLFLDLDRFKTINDTLGHPVGDDLLRVFAERLNRCVRFQDTVCRQGGDEFLILLESVADRGEVETVATRILEATSEPFTWDGRALTTSCSIGIAMYPDDGDDFDTLLKRADIAMYQSKTSGRNVFHFYGSGSITTASVVDDLELENGLRGALERNELSICYQPIVELATRRVIGAEALLRWTSPERGPIPPARFIPIAEESGLIVPIGEWVLDEACREARRWQREGKPPLKLAVNISGVQFMRSDLADVVEGILQRSGLSADALELEITESMLVTHVERCVETIRLLHLMGVSLAVDDFGTGFSNLGYLKRFHVDTLKVDQSFVRDVLRDREGASIVRAIIELGRSLSLSTLAEGVERQEQADHLLAAGCQMAQGFFFSRPLPAQEFRAFLEASRERQRTSSPAPGHAIA